MIKPGPNCSIVATIYAGNSEVRQVSLALESLVSFGIEQPQKIVVLRGFGGDGKSAYSSLRSNIFSDTHQYMSPSVFEVDEEFRKQGSSYAGARFITIQECNGGSSMQESIFKSFVGGEKIA